MWVCMHAFIHVDWYAIHTLIPSHLVLYTLPNVICLLQAHARASSTWSCHGVPLLRGFAGTVLVGPTICPSMQEVGHVSV